MSGRFHFTSPLHLPVSADGCAIKNSFGVIIARADYDVTAAALANMINLGGAASDEAADRVDLSMFETGRRPPFFYDVPVRDLLISCRRRMTTDQARALCAAEFGEQRTPSRSAINRFWLKLAEGAVWNPAIKGRLEAANRKEALAAEAQEPVAEIQIVRCSNPQPQTRPNDLDALWTDIIFAPGWMTRPSRWKRLRRWLCKAWKGAAA